MLTDIRWNFCRCTLFLLSVLAGVVGSWPARGMANDDLSEFVLHPDCRVQLVAKEPQVIDPVAIRFDDRGRLWVVEMRDYPVLESAVPKSRIKILQDQDNDGFFETATVFADQLRFPTGIQPWRKGVLVTLEGCVVYLADNDGDLKCDEEQILFKGFAIDNTQLRANHPTLGPDGWVYVANGLRNGEIRCLRTGKQLSLNGKDFRFDPSTLEFQAVAGFGQYGLTFDAHANRFVCTNRNPLKRVLFEFSDLLPIKGRVTPTSVVDVAAAAAESRLFPIGKTWTTSNLHANQFTAACGVHIYGGNLLTAFQGNAFVCDPTANLVHREVISYRQNQVVGKSKPGRKGVEFLASKSSEFRPVDLITGPDGALYVVDMRRTVIEHPQFMPPELKQRPDLRNGDDLGRIYRIVESRKLETRSTSSLKAERQIYGPNSWDRMTAHRLLLEKSGKVDWKELRNGLGRPESHFNGIMRALALLRQNDQLESIDYDFALSHYSVPVRKLAVRFCEGIRPEAIRAATMDESPVVRLQAILSATRSNVPLSVTELKTIALYGADDPSIQHALINASKGCSINFLMQLLDYANNTPAQFDQLHQNKDLARTLGQAVSMAELLVPVASEADPEATLALAKSFLVGWVQGKHKQLSGIDDKNKATESIKVGAGKLVFAFLRQSAIRNRLLRIEFFANREFPGVREKFQARVDSEEALEFLALTNPNDPTVTQVALDRRSGPGRLAAIRLLEFSESDNGWMELAKQFRSLTFSQRQLVLDAAIRRPKVAVSVLELIENGDLKMNELSLTTRNRFLKHGHTGVRVLAQKLLRKPAPADRDLTFKSFRSALTLEAKPARGRPVFEKSCASCHRLGKLGRQIGPDISDTRTKSKSQLLLDIVQPNAAIDNHFVEYHVATTDGRSFTGIIVDNTQNALVLHQADNQRISIPHQSIDEMKSTGKSMMPVGLEQGMSLQQMADLISFLQNWRYLQDEVPFEEKNNAK